MANYINDENIPIFIAAYWDYQLERESFKRGLEEFILKHGSYNIYLMPENPILLSNPIRSERLKYIGIYFKNNILPSYVYRNKYLYELSEKYKNLTYISLDDDFFKRELLENKNFIYYDKHHLNEIGAILYAISSKDKIRNLLK